MVKASYRVVKDIDTRTFLELRRRADLNKRVVQVGLPENKYYRERDQKTGKLKRLARKGKRILLAAIGATHELGALERGIPARPWLRPGVRSGKPDYVRLNRVNLLRIMKGTMSQEVALKQLGAMAQGKVQQYIRQSDNFKPLKQSTIDRKGSSKPLIDTGQMIQSITYKVVDNKP